MSKTKTKEKTPKPKFGMLSCIGFMVRLAAKHEPFVLVGLAIMVVLSTVQSLIDLFVSPMVISAVENRVPLVRLIASILAMIVGLALVNAIRNYINGFYLYYKVTLRCACIALLNDKLCKTSMCHFDDDEFRKKKDKASEAMGNNSAATEAIWITLRNFLQNIIGFVIYLLMLTNVSPVIVLVIIATTIPNYFISKYVNDWGYRHKDEEREINRGVEVVNHTADDKRIAKDIRIFGMKPWLDDLYKQGIALQQAFYVKGEKVRIWSNIVGITATFLRNGIAYAYLIGLVLNGGLTASEFLLYFSVVGGFSSWIWGILSDFADLHRKCLDLSTVRECLEYPEPYKFEDGEHVPSDKCPPEIRLENVSFKYPGAENNTLENINLTLRPGEKIAVVGLNGAGKTTLVKIISGLYDPTEGRVTYNGIDIRTLNRREYYGKFTAIFQNLTEIPASIAANVACSETEIDMDRVNSCIGQAGLEEKIMSLPDGYETKLNRQIFDEAVELSGGEMQRLMLARALYKEAPVLILDEPTAALDPIAESEIYTKYNEMTSGRSAVYISHRLASTRFCDRIILLGDNRILEEGSHDELLRRGGKYAELFEIQSRYYRKDFKADREEAKA